MNKYEAAWNELKEALQERTTWGRNQILLKMSQILYEAEISILRNEKSILSEEVIK